MLKFTFYRSAVDLHILQFNYTYKPSTTFFISLRKVSFYDVYLGRYLPNLLFKLGILFLAETSILINADSLQFSVLSLNIFNTKTYRHTVHNYFRIILFVPTGFDFYL